jgi:RNA polymerase sigma-B factor
MPSWTSTPDDLDAATRSRSGCRPTPPAAIPSYRSGSFWPIWAWPTGLASRYRRSRGVTPEDLTQTARAGLIAAVDRYDPDYGSRFVPYAAACVIGEAQTLPAGHQLAPACAPSTQGISPTARSDFRRAAPAPGPLPATGELAEQLEVGEEEVLKAMTAVTSRWEVSLDQPAGSATPRCMSPACSAGPGVHTQLLES